MKLLLLHLVGGVVLDVGGGEFVNFCFVGSNDMLAVV